MIWDAFLFYDEFHLLDLRIETLKPLGVRHLLIESEMTFTGRRKPLFYRDRALRQRDLVAEVVDLDSRTEDPWVRERQQRDAIKSALEVHGAGPDDYILAGDCDEIPRPESIEQAIHILEHKKEILLVVFLQRQFYYWLNVLDPEEQCWGTRLVRASDVMNDSIAVSSLRLRSWTPYRQGEVKDAGWNFGWCFGGTNRRLIAGIRDKLAAFSHTELNTDAMKDEVFLESCLDEARTIHNGHELLIQPIDSTYPLPLQKDAKRWQEWIRTTPKRSISSTHSAELPAMNS